MVKTLCDMCGKEIDCRVDGVNLDFNDGDVARLFSDLTVLESKQLCIPCACAVVDYIKSERDKKAGGTV